MTRSNIMLVAGVYTVPITVGVACLSPRHKSATLFWNKNIPMLTPLIIFSLIQSAAQVVFSALAIAQYFCLIDFLQELPVLLYIRILYYHNANSCGARISIGHAIDGIADQAFVLLRNEPLTSFRTFVINCTSLGLGFLWLLASALLLSGGSNVEKSQPTKWPWIVTTIAICAVDIVASVIFANDSFYTRTLSDIMNYIGGVVSGAGSVELDTSVVSWVMVVVYSRFVVFFLLNVLVTILVVTNKPVIVQNVEAQILPPLTYSTTAIQTTYTTSTEVQTSPMSAEPDNTEPVSQPSPTTEAESSLETDRESSVRTFKLPRAGFSYAFRRMKTLLFRKSDVTPKGSLITYSVNISPERSPQRRRDDDKKRTVNFPESCPDGFQAFRQHLENKIADQKRRLDHSIIDTACRQSSPLASQSLPQLNEDQPPNVSRQRRGTLPDLQGQLPWAYIPASTHRMRDQLPSDEDLPPVPLPDYNAMPSLRKTSVHRAASSLSSLTQKKDYTSQIERTKSSLTQSDVLY